MLTLVVEDGTGKSDANSYAARATADAYFEGRLNATAWTGATEGNRDIALVMATRTIDALFRFHGWKRVETQALQWPRIEVPDVDLPGAQVPGLRWSGCTYLPEDEVPAAVVNATCELALALLAEDRTGDPEGAGLVSLGVTGAFSRVFDPTRPKPVVPRLVVGMLRRLGEYCGTGGGAVVLVRV